MRKTVKTGQVELEVVVQGEECVVPVSLLVDGVSGFTVCDAPRSGLLVRSSQMAVFLSNDVLEQVGYRLVDGE